MRRMGGNLVVSTSRDDPELPACLADIYDAECSFVMKRSAICFVHLEMTSRMKGPISGSAHSVSNVLECLL